MLDSFTSVHPYHHDSLFLVELTAVREKMYKSKLKQWGLVKNYKAKEKEHLARIAKAHRDSGKNAPLPTFKNRPAKWNRVRRFCKQQKFLEEICDALPNESTSNASLSSSTKAFAEDHWSVTAGVVQTALKGVRKSPFPSGSGFRQALFDPERPFATDSHEARIELVLFQTRIYLQSRVVSTGDSDTMDYAADWENKLTFGVTALVEQKPTQGWRVLNEACGIFHRVLDEQPQSLFSALFHVLSDHKWTKHLDLSMRLLQFFTKSSAAKLGCNHPISIVLYHLQEKRIFADTIRPAYEVLMDVSEESFSPTSEELWLTKYLYGNILRQREGYAAAELHTLRSLKQCEEVLGRLHWHTRNFLVELSDLYLFQGLYELAGRGYQDVLQRGREDLGGEFPDHTCVYALRGLAWIWQDRGDFARSEEYWREALAGAVELWSMEGDWTIYMIVQLEASFKGQGKDPEPWLQQNFGISCV
jgi:tetratricopeptide (TPR) repeat protein